MKPKNKKILIAVIIILIVAFVGILIYLNFKSTQDQPDEQEITITEISLDDVPDSIRSEMDLVINEAGLYSYREENQEDVYVLLSTGEVVGVGLTVNPSIVDKGVYFGVTCYDNKSLSQLVYKVYLINGTQAISGDSYILQNPYLRAGAEGLNTGLITKDGDTYYVLPLLDQNLINRVYISELDLENGLYEFEYKLGGNGAEITNATKIDSYQVNSQITGFDSINNIVSAKTYPEGIRYEAKVNDEVWIEELSNMDFEVDNLIDKVTLTYDGELVAAK